MRALPAIGTPGTSTGDSGHAHCPRTWARLSLEVPCGPSTPTTGVDPSNSAVNFEIWQPCDAGTVVEWAKVTGANHAWMGHLASPGTQSLVGTAFMGFDSSAAVWSFLSAHARL